MNDLIVPDRSAWPQVEESVAASPYPVQILPAEPDHATHTLHGLQVSTGSWLGAVVYHSGGILIDHGWLRVYGSGHQPRRMPDILEAGTGARAGLVIAHDVLGGEFTWLAPSRDTTPTVRYFAPDSLEWQDLEVGYGHWLHAMLSGALTQFYENLRWPGWRDEVAACPPDKGIHTFPPPWTAEGKDLAAVSRQTVALTELVNFHHDTAGQLRGRPGTGA